MIPGKGSVVGERFVTNETVCKIVSRARPRSAAHRGRLRRPGEASPSSWAARVPTSCSPTPISRRPPQRALRRLRECRAGLLRPQPHPRRAQRLRALHGAARACGAGRGSEIRWTSRPRWARSSRRRTWTGCARSCPTTRMSRSRRRAHGTRVLVRADRAHAVADARTAREEIFGPVVSVFPFDDEGDAIRFANASEYGLSAPSSPATSAEASAWPVPSSRGTSASTRTRRCATRRPSAGSGSRASGASSDPTLPRLHGDEERVHRHRLTTVR